MILLVSSNKDLASKNIANQLLQSYSFKKTSQTYQKNPVYTIKIAQNKTFLITLNSESVNAQNLLDDFPSSKLVVFISRHSSQSQTPTLSVHTPGNFTTANLGGLPQTLSVSPAKAMFYALKSLNTQKQEKNLNYQVCYECTHHGPSLKVPALFVELGSSSKQWTDQTAANAVANAAINAIENFTNTSQTAAIGIGGPHYNQKFTNLALATNTLIGHIIPKYTISQLTPQILNQCIQKTYEKVTSILLDWKGIKSQDKPLLLEIIKQTNLPTKKI